MWMVLLTAAMSCGAPEARLADQAEDCRTGDERAAGVTMDELYEDWGPEACEMPPCEPIEGKPDYGVEREPPDDAPECRASIARTVSEPCDFDDASRPPPCSSPPPPPGG